MEKLNFNISITCSMKVNMQHPKLKYIRINCANPVYRAGVCKEHYKDYLIIIINQMKIDPIQLFTLEELQNIILLHGEDLPKSIGEKENIQDEYRESLIKIAKKKIPCDFISTNHTDLLTAKKYSNGIQNNPLNQPNTEHLPKYTTRVTEGETQFTSEDAIHGDASSLIAKYSSGSSQRCNDYYDSEFQDAFEPELKKQTFAKEKKNTKSKQLRQRIDQLKLMSESETSWLQSSVNSLNTIPESISYQELDDYGNDVFDFGESDQTIDSTNNASNRSFNNNDPTFSVADIEKHTADISCTEENSVEKIDNHTSDAIEDNDSLIEKQDIAVPGVRHSQLLQVQFSSETYVAVTTASESENTDTKSTELNTKETKINLLSVDQEHSLETLKLPEVINTNHTTNTAAYTVPTVSDIQHFLPCDQDVKIEMPQVQFSSETYMAATTASESENTDTKPTESDTKETKINLSVDQEHSLETLKLPEDVNTNCTRNTVACTIPTVSDIQLFLPCDQDVKIEMPVHNTTSESTTSDAEIGLPILSGHNNQNHNKNMSSCHQEGHDVRTCPTNESPTVKRCGICQEEGHDRRTCLLNPELSVRRCSVCHQEGHDIRTCPHNQTPIVKRCGICGQEGHNRKTCQLNPELSVRRCSVCHQEGHDIRTCPHNQTPIVRRCGICGQEGHNQRTCSYNNSVKEVSRSNVSYQRESTFQQPTRSRQCCGACGQPGHNRRTCSYR